MDKNSLLYPPTPSGVPRSVTESSASFKKEVSNVMGAILLFFIVYILLFALAVGLAVACVGGGIFIVSVIHNLWVLLAGIGLIGVGIMVLIFLIKFLFAVSKFDRSGSIEIKEQEQPLLFAFIKQLTKDTQTHFPKKIYLSPEVNACVFYDSSFWSMFFPIKKNLQIGLGLVNAVNLSEFKAVMAHEFGHFSQSSMKLGSFVYQVNRIIYNMLYENNSYGSFLSSWARVSSTFAFFASITVKIIQGIQWVLQKMYGFINKSYMGLSREMEFHADAVAASVSGGNNCISALQRIELADSGYNLVLRKYDELLKEKKVAQNVYANHRIVLHQLAESFGLSIQNDLPVVSRAFLNSNNLSRINFKNQWASHPTTEEREVRLNELGVNSEANQESAWVLFSQHEKLQEQLTKKIYQHIEIKDEIIAVDNKEFKSIYLKDEAHFTFPAAYRGYYDARNSRLLDVNVIIAEHKLSLPLSFESIFNSSHVALSKKIRALENDIEVLKSLAAGQLIINTFDFDGEKYERGQADDISAKLEKELAEQKNLLDEADKNAFLFFYRAAADHSSEKSLELKQAYHSYFTLRRNSDLFLEQVNKMLAALQPIYAGETQPIETINAQIATLKQSHEFMFKNFLREWQKAGAFVHKDFLKERVDKFIHANYAYFSGTSFFENELAELNQLVQESWIAISDYLFIQFKAILEKQLIYLPNQ